MTYRIVAIVGLIMFASAARAASGPNSPSQTAAGAGQLQTAAATSAVAAPPTSASAPAPQPGAAQSAPFEAGSELTLKQAISVALRYHPRAKQAYEETHAATERTGQARAYLAPQVFGVAQYLRSTDNGIGNTEYYNPEGAFPRVSGRNHNLPSNDFSQSSQTSDNYMGGVAATQFLFDLGRRRGFVDQRRYEADAAAGEEQTTDLDLIFEVSRRYFDLLQARQMVRVFQKAVEQRQFHRHEAEVKARAELRPELDVYITQAEVQRAQLHLVDAQNAQADAKVGLDNALGLSDNAPAYELADVLSYAPITDTAGSLLQTAMSARPDLKALESQARAMGAEIKEYRSDYFPTLSAVTGYSGMGTGLPVVNNFNVGVVVTWPIFNGFLTTHQVAEASFRRRAIEHAIDDLRQRVILEVRTAFLNWQASLKRIDRAEKTLVASRAELELAEKRYEAGLSDIVELEDAQRQYTQDDAEYANSLYNYAVAEAAVDRASARSLGTVQ
jgi:outer membrane protein